MDSVYLWYDAEKSKGTIETKRWDEKLMVLNITETGMNESTHHTKAGVDSGGAKLQSDPQIKYK
jgi:hypothetical protein